jgi:hypothetical protein
LGIPQRLRVLGVRSTPVLYSGASASLCRSSGVTRGNDVAIPDPKFNGLLGEKSFQSVEENNDLLISARLHQQCISLARLARVGPVCKSKSSDLY